ncbi:hypothetical protein T484DRAFT_1832407 [Baffinella frigidus]|nr:hypothetical protein T484DRAFT_1832407 [Cryptophyta sp. CCMP2293]
MRRTVFAAVVLASVASVDAFLAPHALLAPTRLHARSSAHAAPARVLVGGRAVGRGGSVAGALRMQEAPAANVAKKPRVVVVAYSLHVEASSQVGAGWGGWAAAKALCENGCDVTLLDGLPDPSGEKPYLTPTGKPFEAGTRGFWKDYPNIEALLAEKNVKLTDVLSDYTGSSFFSPFGLEATAPVFSGPDVMQLPSPLGQATL